VFFFFFFFFLLIFFLFTQDKYNIQNEYTIANIIDAAVKSDLSKESFSLTS